MELTEEKKKMLFRSYTNEDVIAVLKLAQQGKYLSDIEKETKIPYHQINAWCRIAGVEYAKRPRGKNKKYDWARILREVGLPVPGEITENQSV